MEILVQIRGIVDQVNNLLWGKNIRCIRFRSKDNRKNK